MRYESLPEHVRLALHAASKIGAIDQQLSFRGDAWTWKATLKYIDPVSVVLTVYPDRVYADGFEELLDIDTSEARAMLSVFIAAEALFADMRTRLAGCRSPLDASEKLTRAFLQEAREKAAQDELLELGEILVHMAERRPLMVEGATKPGQDMSPFGIPVSITAYDDPIAGAKPLDWESDEVKEAWTDGSRGFVVTLESGYQCYLNPQVSRMLEQAANDTE
jgi:hypothetical protein